MTAEGIEQQQQQHGFLCETGKLSDKFGYDHIFQITSFIIIHYYLIEIIFKYELIQLAPSYDVYDDFNRK